MQCEKNLERYEDYLMQKELSDGSIRIYVREAARLLDFLKGRPVTKETMIAYKKELLSQKQKAATNNLHIVAANSYLKYAGYEDCVIKTERIQKHRSLDNVITAEEYRQVLDYAKESGREKYYYIFKTLALTGMRISELRFLTREVLENGKFTVDNKGKIREIYLSERLVRDLLLYCENSKLYAGVIFRGNREAPISRIAVYKMLRYLGDMVGIDKRKLHPHSLRHLFAVTYMKQFADLTELADILGHSSLETTRIYTTTTAEEKRKRLNGLHF